MVRVEVAFAQLTVVGADELAIIDYQTITSARPIVATGNPVTRRTTCGELNRWANQIARTLVTAHVNPRAAQHNVAETKACASDSARGVRVGLWLHRGAEAAAAILGTLKAGAVVVPLDPAGSVGYVSGVVNDSGATVLLTTATLAGAWTRSGRHDNVVVVVIEPDGPWRATDDSPFHFHDLDDGGSDGSGDAKSTADDDADAWSIVYTSGSTGRPKGVVGSHTALMHRLEWGRTAHPYAIGEVELTNSPLTFIDGLVGLLGPLISGCPVVVATVGADVDGLVAALARHSVTRVTLVPTLLAAIFELIPDVGCRIPTLRILRCSGEPLRPELLARFRTSLPRCTLLNLYGSTEVSGDCTCAVFSPRIDAAIAAVDRASVDVTQSVDIASCTESSITDKHPSVGTASVTIGTPIAGATCTVDGRDNGTGIGELVVGGPLLALRYWRNPEKTAAEFFIDESGARFFRTRDRVWGDIHGGFHFVGRTNREVKIRGVKVDLEVVEDAAAGIACVDAAVAVATSLGRPSGVMDGDDPSADGGLPLAVVEFVTLRGSHRPTGADTDEEVIRGILAELRDQLPTAAVPSRLIILKTIPTNRNGKTDRAALLQLLHAPCSDTHGVVLAPTPSMLPDWPSTSSGHVADTAGVVADVWRARLGLGTATALGFSATFAAHGGDSILLVAVIGDLHQRTGYRVLLSQAPFAARLTVGWLAEELVRMQNAVPAKQRDSRAMLDEISIRIVPFGPTHATEVAALLARIFVEQERLAVAAGVSVDTLLAVVGPYCSGAAAIAPAETLSFVAVDGEDQVVAFTLNDVHGTEAEIDIPLAAVPLFTFIESVDTAYFKTVDPPPSDWAPGSVMHMFASAAAADAPGDRGQLVLELERMAVGRANELGFKRVFTTCTSAVTAFISEHELGFTPRITMRFDDYHHEGRQVFHAPVTGDASVVLLDRVLD